MAGDDETLISITADQVRDIKAVVDGLYVSDPEAAECLRRDTILRVLFTIAKKRTSSPSVLAETARLLYGVGE